ncbi:MAG: heme-copper oxidase subunit III [Thermoplasmata archaeon]
MAPDEAHEAEADEEVHGSPWPIIVALGLGLIFASLGVYGTALLNPLFLLGIAVFAGAVGGWVWDDFRGRRVPYVPGEMKGDEGTLQAFPTRKAAMWVFLASEIMFFSGIIGGSWAVRASFAPDMWPPPGLILNVPLTALNTFLLITSSLAMAEALHAIQQGNQRAFVQRLLITLALGITFLSIQGTEYIALIFEEGLTPFSSPDGWPAAYGSTFYIQTGFHGAHVTGGVIAMSYVTLKARKGGFTAKNHGTVELMGLYWHFVDVVWIFLFTIVYLL